MTTPRTRRRPQAPVDPLPTEKGKFFARLMHGARYEVLKFKRTFVRGEVVEIDAATHKWLVERVEPQRRTYRDPELGRVCRQVHPFDLSPKAPEMPDLHPDLEAA